jgi:chromosome partitioning protein
VLVPIVAVLQQKGGVGKSTITANLAAEFLAAGQTVTAFDLDDQRSLLRWASRGKGVLNQRVTAMNVMPATHHLFRAAVERAQIEANYVLLDCPPGYVAAALSAALLADIVVVPVGPSPLDVDTAKETRDELRAVQRKGAAPAPLIAFVPSRVTQTAWSRGLPGYLEKFGERVFPSISQLVANVESAAKGLALREYLKSDNKGVMEFHRLSEAIRHAMEGQHGQGAH